MLPKKACLAHTESVIASSTIDARYVFDRPSKPCVDLQNFTALQQSGVGSRLHYGRTVSLDKSKISFAAGN